MENKISTSIQYQLTNVKLFNEVFYNWVAFNEQLNKGPEQMKRYLLEEWNHLKEGLKNNEKLILKDIEKEVTENDFNITMNRTKDGSFVFYFTFPDYEYTDAASKYVALAFLPEKPRYFTLEYSENFMTREKKFILGEFVIDQNNLVRHQNYGILENNKIESFAGAVLNLIEEKV